MLSGAVVRQCVCVIFLGLTSLSVVAKDDVDLSVLNRLAEETFNHSELPATAAYLTDRIGARLPNSPQMREAERWTREQFTAWGLKNVRAEAFNFGRGWSIEHASVRMLTPRVRTMRSIPIAWTPSTNGALVGSIVIAPMEELRDFERWKGKLRGKIVLVDWPVATIDATTPPVTRFTEEDLHRLDTYPQPQYVEAEYSLRLKRAAFDAQRDLFLAAEGALAWIRKSNRDGGLVEGSTYGTTAYGFKIGETPTLSGIELAADDYRLLARLAKTGTVPTIEIVSDVTFHDEDANAYNIIADIPGRDAKAGYVMAGAHLDSWVAADGAADNAAGCVAVMEAARILSKLGIKPKRTIRFALWNAEEPGLMGSLAYVERHLAARAPLNDAQVARLNPYFSRSWFNRWPIMPKPGHEKLAAYFNLDNGSGSVRGIYAEGNLAVVPIFKKWLLPFASMGATAVVAGRTSGTDHVPMQAVGIPGFQFVQDPLDYDSRVHHTTLDSYDHLNISDLKQVTLILASFLLNAAERDEPLPRMPLPSRPTPTDPFVYEKGGE